MNSFLVGKYGQNLATQSVEVYCDNTAGKYFLPDDSVLREKKIVAFFAESNDDDNKVSPTGRNLVSPAAIQNARVTIYNVNNKTVDALPLEQVAITPTERDIFPFELQCVTPSKSYVHIPGGTGVTAGESIMLHFVYIDQK